MPARRRVRVHGFTLIEMIVVLAVIALIAAFAVPRMSGSERREFNLAVEQVTDLLTMFAQRDSLSRRPIGLGLDVPRRRFVLYILDDAGTTDGGSQWQPDRLVRPMAIPNAIDLDAMRISVDDLPTRITDHPLSHAPGELRPTIRIDLQTESGRYRTSVVLSPHAVAPRRIDDDGADLELMPVDLDRDGRSREDW